MVAGTGNTPTGLESTLMLSVSCLARICVAPPAKRSSFFGLAKKSGSGDGTRGPGPERAPRGP